MEKGKIWYKTEFVNSVDQNISIYEDTSSLIIEAKDEDESYRIYLEKNEAELFINKLTDMFNHIFSEE
jgi:DNA-dependent RNA polymerase auxiliary subunit epsilon